MITEKLPFLLFQWQPLLGNTFLHENNAAYLSKLLLKNGAKQIKNFHEKLS